MAFRLFKVPHAAPVFFIIALFCLGLIRTKADLPEQGEVIYPAENLSILDFSGIQFTFSKSVQSGTFELTNCVLAHSISTGQISGVGDGAVRGISAKGPNFIRTGQISGKFFFIAKPVKRGRIVTLPGAKTISYATGSGFFSSTGDIPFNFVSRPVFNFKSLEVNFSNQPPKLSGFLRSGMFSVSTNGYVSGKEFKGNVHVPYREIALDDIEIPPRNVISISAEISYMDKNLWGVAQGSAARLLSNENTSPSGSYAIKGYRSSKLGISKLKFFGIGPFNGASAVLYVDDAYQIQTGWGFLNSLRAYGYYIVF